jgi:osmotically-inducible protein OsmY
MATATPVRTDEQIQRAVLEELAWDSRVHPNEVGVSVKDGVVTLTGWVDGFTKKWAAEDAALRVRGVKAVANDIEVRLPSSAERTDADIAAAAARALQWNALVPADQIQVAVSKGYITLKGEAEWQFQREEAERSVRNLTGVRGVVNLIAVKPHVKPSANELKRRIEAALVRTAETDAERIAVDVNDDGKVILRGTVHSWAEKREAERVAWSAPGAREVENLITIEL